jgi:hypothetical protein
MLYMVLEHFKDQDPLPVYRRFRDQGRLAPEGLRYVASWIDEKLERWSPARRMDLEVERYREF